ncbi:GntR family transcriptional regulator [Paenibacillus guangzhouensis]|uniref:GntR family transcriptional regulator n=1 Tax=Paenibacillus guangzhouensis TaxID=1473112 RepID=UPI001267779C|nr:GntR family transcriptional regulator [Paenibacillus guangzhouensis]
MKKLLYQQVFDAIEEKIIHGEYQIQDKLPFEHELADEYNVSIITVKRALDELKKQGYISRKPKQGTIVISNTKQTTPAAVQHFHLPLIGCIMTDFNDTFGTKILSGILEASDSRAHVIVKKSLGHMQVEEQLIQEFIQMNVAGILLLPSTSKYLSPIILELASRKFPLIVIDRTLENLPISSITTNNTESAEILTSHLIDLGHKHIGIVTSSNIVSTVEERIQGYVQAHAANHVSMDPSLRYSFVESVIPGSDVHFQEDIDKIASFIEEHPAMTGIVATEYSIALLIRQACDQIGKRVPEDLSVVCFDHPDNYYNQAGFRFTHIQQPQHRLGEECITQIMQLINNPASVAKVNLVGELVVGYSTRKTEG